MARLTQCLLLLISLAAALAPTTVSAGEALTLGVPVRLLPDTPMKPPSLDQLVGDLTAPLRCREPSCGGHPTVKLSIALGTDYEILDWFGKGLLDLAVVPEVSAFVLQNDGLRFRRYALATDNAPARAPDDGARIERFAQWVWCQARARARSVDRWEAERRLVQNVESGTDPMCAGSEPATSRQELQVTSHLVGFPGVVDVVAPWLALRIGRWSCEADHGLVEARAYLEDAFWAEFLLHTRFTMGGHPPAPAGTQAVRVASGPAVQRLIVTRPVARRLGLSTSTAPEPSAPEPWSRRCADSDSLGVRQVPVPFAPALLTEPAFGVRTFLFSPRETIDLLRIHKTRATRIVRPVAPADDTPELALVLPGGGVKSAYQSVLVERLYRERLLVNAPGVLPASPGAPVNVDYVIGTSGGALLGYFAARLSGQGPWDLDTKLWQWCDKTDPTQQKSCRQMRSTDIFGYIDMLRYVSAVMMLVVLAVVLYFWLPVPAGAAGTVRWRMRLLLSVVPALMVIPLLVRYVNGDQTREHIPEVEGFVFAAAVLLAMFADQCLVMEDRAGAPARPGGRRWRFGVALAVVGGVMALGPVLVTWLAAQKWVAEWPRLHASLPVAWLQGAWRLERIVFGRDLFIHKGALLLCLGGLLALIGIVLLIWRDPHYQLVTWREFLSGFGVGLLQIFLASIGIGLIVAAWPYGHPSFLELTLEYWVALVAASIAAAFVLIAVRRLRARARVADWVAGGIDYLTSGHPNGGSTRRIVRFVTQAALATAWWSIVLAPGVYGNGLAIEFLRSLDERFLLEFPRATSLKAPLIVTANVLKAEGARYFAFLPNADDCLNISRRSGYGATWLTHWPGPLPATPAVDARCVREPQDVAQWDLPYIRSIVFASGSPYPVFPAHRIDDKIGRLVDGGYANNVPLDAAQGVGADQVLIVESSNPLGHSVVPSFLGLVRDAVRIQGDLVDNLPALFTFLYERSQELDRISRRELLVVSLAPSREEAGWPTLVQFTGAVIGRMRKVAKEDWDQGRRIGLVQSWGRPRTIHDTTLTAARDGRLSVAR